jgi:hypothetical protein
MADGNLALVEVFNHPCCIVNTWLRSVRKMMMLEMGTRLQGSNPGFVKRSWPTWRPGGRDP